MNVLSLFDGMSCGRVALERAGIPVDRYYSSEIDKWAIKIADKNWPQDTPYRVGDVTKWKEWEVDGHPFPWSSIDLVLAGSPCQSISNLGKREGLEGKSGLFFCFLDILNHIKIVNPDVKFLLENVVGNKEAIATISELVGVEPALINSSEFSAQSRRRLYWTNLRIDEWNTKSVKLEDILSDESSVDSSLYLKGTGLNKLNRNRNRATHTDRLKMPCLLASQEKKPTDAVVLFNDTMPYRYPTRAEMERAQTVPEGYTSEVSYNNAAKCLGNGWTVDVIAHILKSL